MAITNFIPTLWSARLLENLRKTLVYGQTGIINRNYEGEIRARGDTVKILSVGTISVGDYTKDSDISWQVLNDAAQVLTIERQKYFAFEVDDVDAAQSAVDIMDAAMREAAYALGDAADQYIASKMVAEVANSNKIGSDASPIQLVAGAPQTGQKNVYEALVDMRVKLDRANVPTEGRWVIVPPEVYALLLKDTRFVVAQPNPQAGRALLNGEVGEIAGFRVFVSNNVPEGSSAKYRILAGYPDATTYAEQINKVEAIRRENRFADAVKGLHLYGAKVTRPDGLVLMIAQVAA